MKVLIVDDHPLFLDALSEVLRRFNRSIKISTAVSADLALSIIEKTPTLDLVLLDLGLPGLDGLSFLKQLKNLSIVIPVIIVSSSDDPIAISQALALGVVGYIPKSHSSEQMQQSIELAMRGEQVIPKHLLKLINDLSSEQEKCLEQLNLREKQLKVLELMAQGLSNTEIAEGLFISSHTVKSHTTKIFNALNCKGRLEAVLEAKRLGLLIG